MKSYYEILGVAANADDKTIRAAYLQLQKENDPNRYPEKSEAFQQVQQAYQILSDPEKRNIYDAKLAKQQHANQNTGLTFSLDASIQAAASSSSSSALVPHVEYDLFDVVKKAGTSPQQLITLGQTDIRIARAIISKPEFCHYNVIYNLGMKYEEIAKTLTNNPALSRRLRDWALYNLAKTHRTACIAILSNEQLATQLSGQELHALSQEHGEAILAQAPATAKAAYDAYKHLLNPATLHDDNFLAQCLIDTKPNQNQLIDLGQSNIRIARAIISKPEFCHHDVIYNLGMKYEEIAKTLTNNPALSRRLRDWALYNLAKTHRTVCIAILSNEQLATQLSGQELHELNQKHGYQITQLMFRFPKVREKFDAYALLLSATQKDCLRLEAGAAADDLHFSAADKAYNMGLALLANVEEGSTKQENTLHQKMLAAVYLADAGQQGHGPALQRLVELAKETNQDQIKIEIARIYADEGNPHFNLKNACLWYRAAITEEHAIVELLNILRFRYEGNLEEKLSELSIDIDLETIKKSIESISTTSIANLVYYNSLLGLFFIGIEQLEQASVFFAKTIVGRASNNVPFLDKAYQSLMPSENKYDFFELASRMMDEIATEQKEVLLKQEPTLNDDLSKLEEKLKEPDLLKRRLRAAIPFFVLAAANGDNHAISCLIRMTKDIVAHDIHISAILELLLPPETSVEAINHVALRIQNILLHFPHLISFIAHKLQAENISLDELDAHLKMWEVDVEEKIQWHDLLSARLNLLLRPSNDQQADLYQETAFLVSALKTNLLQTVDLYYQKKHQGEVTHLFKNLKESILATLNNQHDTYTHSVLLGLLLPPETSVEAINHVALRIQNILFHFPYLISSIAHKLQAENISLDELDAYLKMWEADREEKQQWCLTINNRLNLLSNYLSYRAGDLYQQKKLAVSELKTNLLQIIDTHYENKHADVATDLSKDLNENIIAILDNKANVVNQHNGMINEIGKRIATFTFFSVPPTKTAETLEQLGKEIDEFSKLLQR